MIGHLNSWQIAPFKYILASSTLGIKRHCFSVRFSQAVVSSGSGLQQTDRPHELIKGPGHSAVRQKLPGH
jgi:hypothetical protein